MGKRNPLEVDFDEFQPDENEENDEEVSDTELEQLGQGTFIDPGVEDIDVELDDEELERLAREIEPDVPRDYQPDE
jgi:hypothetical protein